MRKYKSVFKSPVDGRFYGHNYHPDQDPSAMKYLRSALTPEDISDIEISVVLDEVLGLAWPQYTLRNICRVIPMDNLVMRLDIATKATGHEKVLPLEEADIKKNAWSTVSFDLWKNIVHMPFSDEAIKKAAHDVMAVGMLNAAREIPRMEDSQIKTIVEAATNTSAGSDWGTVTSGRSANNPYTDILTAIEMIEGTNGFEPTHMAAHPLVWMDFFGNDFVKGQLQGIVLPGGKVFDLPGMPGMRGVSSWSLTSTQALVVSATAPAVVLGKGPTEMADYRNEVAGYDAFILRDWMEPKIVQQEAIYELTAVHA